MTRPESPRSPAATAVSEPLSELPADLATRPAEEGVRRILLATLHRTEAAAARLSDPNDGEALHDFRVGLRRLRSQLKAFGEWLEPEIPRRVERRLRKAARATNSGRDAEVQARALRDIADGSALSPAARALALGLAKRLAAERDQAGEEAIERARRGFEAVARPLDKRLRRLHLEVDLAAGPAADPTQGESSSGERFGTVAARRISAQLARTRERLEIVRGIDPPDALHAARIEGKRLRYLLEPLRDVDPGIAPLLVELKRLQDLLGDFHDACVLQQIAADELLAQARERAAGTLAAVAASGLTSPPARRARRRGLPWAALEIVDLARRRQRAAWRRIRREGAARQELFEKIAKRVGFAEAPDSAL